MDFFFFLFVSFLSIKWTMAPVWVDDDACEALRGDGEKLHFWQVVGSIHCFFITSSLGNWTRGDCWRLYQWSTSCAPRWYRVGYSIAKLSSALSLISPTERRGSGERWCCRAEWSSVWKWCKKHLRSCCSNIFSPIGRPAIERRPAHLNGYPGRWEALRGERKHEKWMRHRGG